LRLHAFTDEYGDTGIAVEKSGVTDFFIITAVLVKDADLAQQRVRAQQIRSRFFGDGEMKSSSLGANDERRISLLEQLSELDVRTYTLAVDKRELDRAGGLAYRKSFFKFLNRRLFEKVYRLFEAVDLVADEHGRESFMESFESYVDRELPLTLFGRGDFAFKNSKDEVMLQVADVFAGSLARVVDPGKLSLFADNILSLLAKRSVGTELWPPRPMPDPQQSLNQSPKTRRDEAVRRHCIRQAQLFVADKTGQSRLDEDVRIQLNVLEMLLFAVQFGDEQEYIPSHRILDALEDGLGQRIGERKLRSAVSSLRDAGVVIGTSQRGYKIPVSEADVGEFVAHANSIVPPMLMRLQRARSDLRAASLGDIDVLSSDVFDTLRLLVDALPGWPTA
jgi:hypothetical protein